MRFIWFVVNIWFLTNVTSAPVNPNDSSSVQQAIQGLQTKVNKLEQETTWLKSENLRLWNDVSSVDAYCSISAEGKCGPCKCRDNYKLPEKYYCDCQSLTPERDCRAFYDAGNRIDGVYKIHNNNLKLMQVYCDQTTDGGGWTVFQRRADGTVNFYRDWYNYKVGFGDLTNEFWLGNDDLFILSLQAILPQRSELRIELGLWDGSKRYAKYGNFQIGDESTSYLIHLSHFSGDAGDGFANGGASANGHKFTTYDRDNDIWGSNCATRYKGGWWYDNCHSANLNGRYYYFNEYPGGSTGLHWYTLDKHTSTLKSSEMKIRRK